MKIKRCPVVLHNVISTKARCRIDEWDVPARELRNAIVKNGLYGTGPIVYQVYGYDPSSEEADYVFMLPVSQPINMPENGKFGFVREWEHQDGFVLRHADPDDDIEQSYEILRACAHANQVRLQEPFYHIYLDVYGEGIIDIYAPIAQEE
ncbi:DUF5085 domain-containing protein [Cohnella fermenti]|uniref:DUF5085 domain-containing protein n=1 Tax=Cohnella fermenti TaxID=2565925 RepID=A0A4S4BN58_9BACL|nr:DUF5085 domain-containing protein [Cohnella fermenti]THF73929.1 DUF5085 domain-containing protein [Cohnella fermenti]